MKFRSKLYFSFGLLILISLTGTLVLFSSINDIKNNYNDITNKELVKLNIANDIKYYDSELTSSLKEYLLNPKLDILNKYLNYGNKLDTTIKNAKGNSSSIEEENIFQGIDNVNNILVDQETWMMNQTVANQNEINNLLRGNYAHEKANYYNNLTLFFNYASNEYNSALANNNTNELTNLSVLLQVANDIRYYDALLTQDLYKILYTPLNSTNYQNQYNTAGDELVLSLNKAIGMTSTNASIQGWFNNVNYENDILVNYETFMISESQKNAVQILNYFYGPYSGNKTIYANYYNQYFQLENQKFEDLKVNMDNTVNFAIASAFFIIVITAIIGTVLSYIMVKSLIKPLHYVADTSSAIATGDLTSDFSKIYEADDEIGKLNKSFISMSEYLKKTVKTIIEAADNIASSSEEMATSSEEVNASSEEISAITQRISVGTQNQTKQVTHSVESAKGLNSIFQEKIKDIKLASNLIESITSQVNMLALNASIEAARAGEYGRGFAVVADNIRGLADEAKISLDKVNTVVEDLDKSLGRNISMITKSIEEVVNISEDTAAGAEEASAATEEQAATMEEITASSQVLADQAGKLRELVKHFRV